MTNVKTAISVQEALFEQAEKIAQEMNISRSHLFTLALDDFIQRYNNRRILEQINEAYSGGPDPEDEIRSLKMRRIQKSLVEGEWR